jgi:hypothetical protein
MVGSISYNLYSYPWQALFPAFITMILVVGFSFLGEGTREASDVKVRPYILFKGKAFKDKAKAPPKDRLPVARQDAI